jgi:uncharacterized LabA/DUF88 family protein
MSDSKLEDLKCEVRSLKEETVALRTIINQLNESASRANPEKVIIFIDNTNLNLTARKVDPSYRLCYNKLTRLLTDGRFLKQVRIYYSDFDPHRPLPPEQAAQRADRDKFYSWLRFQGFYLKGMPLQDRSDGSTKEKGLDAAIIRDMERLMSRNACDTVILVSGDLDYKESLTEAWGTYGVRTEVAFFENYTAGALKSVTTKFTDLTVVRSIIQRDDHRSDTRKVA